MCVYMQNARKQQRAFLEKLRAQTRVDHYLSAGAMKIFNPLNFNSLTLECSNFEVAEPEKAHQY